MRIGSKKHALEANHRGSREKMFGNNGELNANDRVEALRRLSELASMIGAGEVAGLNDNGDIRETAAERRAAVEEAYHSTDGSWNELGASLAGEINTRVEREGFMRTLLARYEVAQGSVPRIKVRTPNVRAVMTRGVTQIWPQFVRDKYINTDEFYISANPRVEEIELAQGSSDILEDKFFEGLEAILVKEDAILKAMMDATAGSYNDVIYFAGQFTPAVLSALKSNIERWRLPAVNMVFDVSLLNDILVGTDFSTYFDPITKYELISTGRIGRLFGTDMITDGYREPSLQVLDKGEIYMTSTPEMTGGYTDRGPVNSRPVDMGDQIVPARGWAMTEIVSILLANGRAVSKAKRL